MTIGQPSRKQERQFRPTPLLDTPPITEAVVRSPKRERLLASIPTCKKLRDAPFAALAGSTARGTSRPRESPHADEAAFRCRSRGDSRTGLNRLMPKGVVKARDVGLEF